MSTPPSTGTFTINAGPPCENCGKFGVHVCMIVAHPTPYCGHFDIDQATGIRSAKIDSGPSLEEVKAQLAELSSKLEKHLKVVSDGMVDPDLRVEDYHFDAGFTAGLRVALNELAHVTYKL